MSWLIFTIGFFSGLLPGLGLALWTMREIKGLARDQADVDRKLDEVRAELHSVTDRLEEAQARAYGVLLEKTPPNG